MSKQPVDMAEIATAVSADLDAEPEATGGTRSLVRYGIIGIAILAALGAAGWFAVPRLLGRAPAAAHELKREPPIKATVPLGAVVVNIGRPETRRYLKVAVELGLPSQKESKEIEEHKSQLTDLLITVVTATPIEQLAADDGKAALKSALLARMHQELGLEAVKRVYFTEFVIQ